MYTVEQIENAVPYEEWWGALEYNDTVELDLCNETVELAKVEAKFGEEGDWNTSTFVIVRIGDQLFRKHGHYASHDGEYWEGALEEVEPVEKAITVYETVYEEKR